MAAGHLDTLRVRDHLALPVNHSVALGIDAGQPHTIKGEEPRVIVAEPTSAVGGEARVSARPSAGMDGAPGDVDGEQGGRAGAEHALEVGSHRDGVRHPIGAAGGERAGEVATAAVSDKRDAAPV
jgi:hypothetical protein